MYVFKEQDLNAPRFRLAKYRYNLITKELYDKFRWDHPMTKISWAEFRKINETINDTYFREILTNREGAILPGQMGRIWLGLFKPKIKPRAKYINRETGIRPIFFSFETGGLLGKIIWDFKLTRYKVKNHEFYGFAAHRDLKRMTSECFKNNPEFYSRRYGIIRREERLKNINKENLERALSKLNDTSGDKSGEGTPQISEL